MDKQDFKQRRTQIISEMLDNPDHLGIYPTGKAFEDLDRLFDEITFKKTNNNLANVEHAQDWSEIADELYQTSAKGESILKLSQKFKIERI